MLHLSVIPCLATLMGVRLGLINKVNSVTKTYIDRLEIKLNRRKTFNLKYILTHTKVVTHEEQRGLKSPMECSVPSGPHTYSHPIHISRIPIRTYHTVLRTRIIMIIHTHVYLPRTMSNVLYV